LYVYNFPNARQFPVQDNVAAAGMGEEKLIGVCLASFFIQLRDSATVSFYCFIQQ
jgi:hypothetical protein